MGAELASSNMVGYLVDSPKATALISSNNILEGHLGSLGSLGVTALGAASAGLVMGLAFKCSECMQAGSKDVNEQDEENTRPLLSDADDVDSEGSTVCSGSG